MCAKEERVAWLVREQPKKKVKPLKGTKTNSLEKLRLRCIAHTTQHHFLKALCVQICIMLNFSYASTISYGLYVRTLFSHRRVALFSHRRKIHMGMCMCAHMYFHCTYLKTSPTSEGKSECERVKELHKETGWFHRITIQLTLLVLFVHIPLAMACLIYT